MMPIFFLVYSNYSFHEILRFVIQNKFKQRKRKEYTAKAYELCEGS